MLDSALVGRQQGNSYPLRDAHDARSRVSPTRFLHPRDWMVGRSSTSCARKAQWFPRDGEPQVCVDRSRPPAMGVHGNVSAQSATMQVYGQCILFSILPEWVGSCYFLGILGNPFGGDSVSCYGRVSNPMHQMVWCIGLLLRPMGKDYE
jgi:hypothetical protein